MTTATNAPLLSGLNAGAAALLSNAVLGGAASPSRDAGAFARELLQAVTDLFPAEAEARAARSVFNDEGPG